MWSVGFLVGNKFETHIRPKKNTHTLLEISGRSRGSEKWTCGAILRDAAVSLTFRGMPQRCETGDVQRNCHWCGQWRSPS